MRSTWEFHAGFNLFQVLNYDLGLASDECEADVNVCKQFYYSYSYTTHSSYIHRGNGKGEGKLAPHT